MPTRSAQHEAPLDRLFAAPFSEYAEVRKALARELREKGERAAADELAAVKRPTRGAWALNQVARRYPKELAAFVALAERIRAAQGRAVSERDAGAVQDVGRQMSASVASIVALATQTIEEDGARATAAIERALKGTLRAVPYLGPEDLDRVTRGLLVADLEPPDDLAVFGAVGPGTPAEPTERSNAVAARQTAAEKRREHEEAKRARAEAARRAKELEKLERAAVEAEREAARLERAAEDTAARARELADDAGAARAVARGARAALETARRQ